MDSLLTRLYALHEDETAVTATEYVSILVLIACFSIGTVTLLGETLTELYEEVYEGMSSGTIRGGLSEDVE